MQQAFSLAHLSMLDLTPPELILAAAEAGYQSVGLRMTAVTPGGAHWPLWRDPTTMAGTKARMAETGVGVFDVELARLEPGTEIAEFKPVFEASAELGARHILTQCDDPEFARGVDNYGRLCDLAAPFGLSCDLEFIPWQQTRDLAAAAALVGAVGRPNAGIMIDSLHFARSGSRLEEIDACPPAWFRYIQLCDAPKAPPGSLEGLLYAAREERLFPGKGELDLVGLLARLPRGIPIALEIPTETLSYTEPPEERARLAREATERVLARVPPPAVSTGSGGAA
jgi:sugar phosphate isomerase/epimerase